MRLVCKDCNIKYKKGSEIWIVLTLKSALGIEEIFVLCPDCMVDNGEAYQIPEYLYDD